MKTMATVTFPFPHPHFPLDICDIWRFPFELLAIFHRRCFNLFRLMCAHKCINCSMHYPLVEWAARVHSFQLVHLNSLHLLFIAL